MWNHTNQLWSWDKRRVSVWPFAILAGCGWLAHYQLWLLFGRRIVKEPQLRLSDTVHCVCPPNDGWSPDNVAAFCAAIFPPWLYPYPVNSQEALCQNKLTRRPEAVSKELVGWEQAASRLALLLLLLLLLAPRSLPVFVSLLWVTGGQRQTKQLHTYMHEFCA